MKRKERGAKKKPSRGLSSLGILVLEVGVYAVLVTAYLILVLRALRPFLLGAFQERRALYAALSVGLMLGQGILLELLTTLLVGFFARARRGEGRSTIGFKE